MGVAALGAILTRPVNGPTSEQLDALLAELHTQIDESSAGVRVTMEWKQIRGVVEDHAARRDAIVADADKLDSAVRTLEAQRDMLALTRDEVAEQERNVERERQRRATEDRQIIELVKQWLPTYSILAVASVVTGPFLGLPFGPFCLVAILPAALGYLEMRRRMQLMEGRSWVVLNDEVREIEARVRLYHIISAVGAGIGLVWFLALLLTGNVA